MYRPASDECEEDASPLAGKDLRGGTGETGACRAAESGSTTPMVNVFPFWKKIAVSLRSYRSSLASACTCIFVRRPMLG